MKHRRQPEPKGLKHIALVLPDNLESILATVTGTVLHGTERIASAALLERLAIPSDNRARQIAGRRLVAPMHALGWHGPKKMRIDARCGAAGYWRHARRPVAPIEAIDFDSDVGVDGELPDALEHVTRLGLKKLARVLRAPSDLGDASLTRAQVTAAGIAVNAQLRADEQRLRAKVTGDVLGRLLQAIEAERKRRDSEGDA